MSGVASAPSATLDDIPKPATGAPPPVQVDSAAGSAVPYARADHTHESRLQARRIQVTPDANGRFVYSFPKPYAQSVLPIVNVTAETPAGAAYRNDATLLDGSVSNTAVTIIISRVPTTVTVTNLLGQVLTIVTPVTTQVWVHIMSRAPS